MEKIIRFRFIFATIAFLVVSLTIFLLWKLFIQMNTAIELDSQFLFFIAAGFVAQMIDGALGMAYGVSCSTLLLSFGIPPAVASASVHTAEVFSTGASGMSHLYFRNVDKKLFLRILIPGMAGAMLGAYLVSKVFEGDVIKPYVSAYLLILGLVLIKKGFAQPKPFQPVKRVGPLGFIGGMLDAIGGGGWGPIVTSNLISKGSSPKETIGTVNTAEFFVTFACTGVFLMFVTITAWQAVLGLIVGSMAAAPLGGWLVSRVRPRPLMIAVGLLVVLTSGYTVAKSLGWVA